MPSISLIRAAYVFLQTFFAIITPALVEHAGIAKRPNAADCKSAGLSAFAGSNPAPSTICPDSSVVERFHGKEEVPSSSLGRGSRIGH